jgi:hypothetical protein
MPHSKPVNWQPISQMPLIASLIDGAREDTENQRQILTEARPRPHLLDDATLDRIERVYREQIEFLEIYEQQIRRWRNASPSAAQSNEMNRMEGAIGYLRAVATEILALAAEVRRGAIDRIVEMSDLELGLQALLGRLPPHRP